MEAQELEQLKYPIGHFEVPKKITEDQIKEWIAVLAALPQRLQDVVSPLSETQLNTPYRPGGWTVRQLVHHIADSHHNSYIRFKWALTEENPWIKAYNEKEWAKLVDYKAPITLSLTYLAALHAKLVYLLEHLGPTEWSRAYIHPEGNQEVSVAENIGRYAWHSNHHYAHIANLVKREGW